MKKAVFVDRDGVINKKMPPHHYVTEPKDFKLIKGVIPVLLHYRDLGYLLVVVTNQRGIGRKMMTWDDLNKVHRKMVADLETLGLKVHGVYVCGHLDEDGCSCRKPKPGLILVAARELGIDVGSSIMIGDEEKDMEAGKMAGVERGYLFRGKRLKLKFKDN